MGVSYRWLKEYVKTELPPEELAERLTLAGISVEAVHPLVPKVEKVVVGEVKRIFPHPQAPHLFVCSLDLGEREIQVVTGAPNVREGKRVAVAQAGALLAGGVEVREAKFRGVVSEGMVCSAQELGLDVSRFPPEEQEGVITFPPATPLGIPLESALCYLGDFHDFLFEFELTPNRADCLALVNLAREVAAVTGAELCLPSFLPEEIKGETEQFLGVRIEAPALCTRYVAKVVREVKVGPSPAWLQQRLQTAGFRSINNVVDITNYVMLELGQPLHAFDLARVRGKQIIVRRAALGEKLVTLDGEERFLTPEMLVIADAQGPVALAGILGGRETEITEQTKEVLIEAALFNPLSIRRTSRALGVASEAALRFEKGIDPEVAPQAAQRAAELIKTWGDGEVVPGLIDVNLKPWKPKEIELRVPRVNALLGTNLSSAEVFQFLSSLGFKVSQADVGLLQVVVPSYRQDLHGEADLIEEVARLYGYDRIPASFPVKITAAEKETSQMRRIAWYRDFLASCGLTEVITYSFMNPEVFELFNLPAEHPWRQGIFLQNPLRREQQMLRTTLLPGLMETASRNLSRQEKNIAIFELGKRYLKLESPLGILVQEKITGAALTMGDHFPGWSRAPYPADFYYLKGILEELARRLHFTFTFQSFTYPAFHPGRTALISIEERPYGILGELHPEILEKLSFTERVCVFELDLELLEEFLATAEKKVYVPPSRFPAGERDLAVVVEARLPAVLVTEVLKKAGAPLLKEVELFDVYEGPQVPPGKKSLAYRLVYQAPDRTLTDAEVEHQHGLILAALARELGAQRR